ncbi:MAG: hypothetical protein SFY69_00660 [Planctomycetota bacterium]|nr:hypothetical protein [Planctomycetota bacterium]
MGVIGQSYPAAKSPGKCGASGRAFSPGEAIVAALVSGERGDLFRVDFAAGAWEAGARPEGDLIGFWRATFSPDAREGPTLLGDDELMDLFEELARASEPRQVAFRYFLSLLLIRRRALRLMGSRPGELLVLAKGATGEPTEVTDPGLEESVVGDAIEQLGRVLGTGEAHAGGTVGA